MSSEPEFVVTRSGLRRFHFQNKSPTLIRKAFPAYFVSLCFILRLKAGNGRVNGATLTTPPSEKPLMSSKRKKLLSSSTTFASRVLDRSFSMAIICIVKVLSSDVTAGYS